MGVSDFSPDTNVGPVVDLSGKGMQKLEPSFICSEDTHTLILDRNHIMKLDYLERSPGLQQLSVASNRLVRMMGVCRLTELRVLNLPNNSIGYIEGLRDLPHLEWLNLAGNNIKVIEQLGNCIALQHLDLSDNNISNIGDLTKLIALKTLLLHGNSITTLRTVPAHFPPQLSILSLAENEIRDLNEVSYLAPLHDLEQLSIMSNPCVMATPSLPGFDYRPYITSWCLSLKVLDGYVVSQKEGLKAEWLYSQGKGRSYRPGQHVQLVQYLANVCPLTSTPALETAEDAKLEKILSKQRFHQRQLMQQTQTGCPSPPRPTQLDVETHCPQHAVPCEGSREEHKATVPTAFTPPMSRQTEPVVQINTWLSCDSSQMSTPVIRSPRTVQEPLYLEDMQTDEDKLNSSLLSSESTFFPVTSNPDPNLVHSDSEDETETFEPDSLAPECPARPKKITIEKIGSPLLEKEQDQEKETVDGDAKSTRSYLNSSSATTADLLVVGGSQPQSHQLPETSFNCGTVETETKPPPKQEDVVMVSNRPGSSETTRAAVKIQSWWRGLYARHFLLQAKEVRSEIRLRRMQDHILFLSGELQRVQRQYEEERLQRLVQEEAVKFLWNQLQSMKTWQQSVEQQLATITQTVTPAPIPSPGHCGSALRLPPPVASSTADPPCTDVSFPDSGFQSTGDQQTGREDSFLSSGTADSLETVRALALGTPVRSACIGGDSPDCSLLEQYLSSVQQREEEAEEGTASDRTSTPQPPSPHSPNKAVQSDSPPRNDTKTAGKELETSPGPV